MLTGELIGYLASCLVFLTFCMKTMMPLRLIAIASNVAFIIYGYNNALYPILVLHSLLMPLNVYRTLQIWRMVQRIRSSKNSTVPVSDLLPFMTEERFKAGEIIFRRGDRSDKLYIVLEGLIRIEEFDIVLSRDALFGEMGMFSADQARTATVSCKTDCRLSSITEEQVLLLYFHNPEFGFRMVRIITKRLLENISQLEKRKIEAGKLSNEAIEQKSVRGS